MLQRKALMLEDEKGRVAVEWLLVGAGQCRRM